MDNNSKLYTIMCRLISASKPDVIDEETMKWFKDIGKDLEIALIIKNQITYCHDDVKKIDCICTTQNNYDKIKEWLNEG